MLNRGVCKSKFLKVSHLKVNRFLHKIRGKSVVDALAFLSLSVGKCGSIVYKVVKSAAYNAGFGDAKEGFFVESAWAVKGTFMKRMRPSAMGRGSVYRRKTCHVTVVVNQTKDIR